MSLATKMSMIGCIKKGKGWEFLILKFLTNAENSQRMFFCFFFLIHLLKSIEILHFVQLLSHYPCKKNTCHLKLMEDVGQFFPQYLSEVDIAVWQLEYVLLQPSQWGHSSGMEGFLIRGGKPIHDSLDLVLLLKRKKCLWSLLERKPKIWSISWRQQSMTCRLKHLATDATILAI